jgi:hypothetical protein
LGSSQRDRANRRQGQIERDLFSDEDGARWLDIFFVT